MIGALRVKIRIQCYTFDSSVTREAVVDMLVVEVLRMERSLFEEAMDGIDGAPIESEIE